MVEDPRSGLCFDRYFAGPIMGVQVGKQPRRFEIAIGDGPAFVINDAFAAEMFGQEHSCGNVARMDLGRAESAGAQCLADCDERHDVFCQMCDPAVRLALADRGTIRPARSIHQNSCFAGKMYRFVASGRCVALKESAFCARSPCLVDEAPERAAAAEPFGEAALAAASARNCSHAALRSL